MFEHLVREYQIEMFVGKVSASILNSAHAFLYRGRHCGRPTRIVACKRIRTPDVETALSAEHDNRAKAAAIVETSAADSRGMLGKVLIVEGRALCHLGSSYSVGCSLCTS